jgi:hypothetical protein
MPEPAPTPGSAPRPRLDEKSATKSPDPVIEAYAAGIDRTLLRENLALSIPERMEKFFSFLRSVDAIRGAASGRSAS